MARFNTTTQGTRQTTNYEGAPAYKLPADLELYSRVLTTTLSNKFYETADENTKKIQQLVQQVDPEFVAKLAVYAREDMYLRSVPLLLTVELAKRMHDMFHNRQNGKPDTSLVRRVVNRVVNRADEITELLACYASFNGRDLKTGKALNKMSKQMQKGLADVFYRFDEYQLAKYNRSRRISLADAYKLVRPKSRADHETAQKYLAGGYKPRTIAEQHAIFDRLVNDRLATPDTWEVAKSRAGQKGQTSKETWEAQIEGRKIGYMACIRNLRNLLDDKVSDTHLHQVADYIANAKAAINSKQFPFRFFTAYREIAEHPHAFGVNILTEALEAAMQITASHHLIGYDTDTRVVVASDVSASMNRVLSDKSSIHMYEVGLLLAMMLQSRCRSVITGIFGETYALANLPKGNILSNAKHLHAVRGKVGHSTNGHLVVQHLVENNIIADKVMIFTDCQLWDSNYSWTVYHDGRHKYQTMKNWWNQYTKIAPDCKLYLFDLAGYGNTPVDVLQKNVWMISGWSGKIFSMVNAIDAGSDPVAEINAITI